MLELDSILDYVPPEMNTDLARPFTLEEVRQSVFMMRANKAPGPDGLTSGFYQYHWDVVGLVTEAVIDYLTEGGGDKPEEINKTRIILIPKCKNPHEMKQFRPISLCKVIYKICSKVLANRLRASLEESRRLYPRSKVRLYREDL